MPAKHSPSLWAVSVFPIYGQENHGSGRPCDFPNARRPRRADHKAAGLTLPLTLCWTRGEVEDAGPAPAASGRSRQPWECWRAGWRGWEPRPPAPVWPSWGIRRHLAQFTPKKQRRLPAPLSTGGWGLPWAPARDPDTKERPIWALIPLLAPRIPTTLRDRTTHLWMGAGCSWRGVRWGRGPRGPRLLTAAPSRQLCPARNRGALSSQAGALNY